MRRKHGYQRLQSVRRGMTAQQQKLLETFLFLLKVIAFSIPLYFVIILGVSLYPLQVIDSTASSAILRAFGYAVQQDGAFVTVASPGSASPFSFILSEDCTAWKSFLFLFALIFAVPRIGLKKRLLGLGFGIPLLWLGNQARVVGVVITERSTSAQFAMLTHDYFWRIFLVALVLGIWLFWLRNPGLSLHKNKVDRKSRNRRILTRRNKHKA